MSAPTAGAGPTRTPGPTAANLRELGPAELDDWDARTVDVPGGDLYQSRPWAEYRARHGWRPRFLAFDDGFRLLALERGWPLVGGAGVYISRGPVSAGEPAERTAARLVAASRWLAAHGVDVVSSDAEVPAGLGYEERIAAAGFARIEEIQPSRHRMALPLAGAPSEDALLMGIDATTRQRIRGAERKGLRVVRIEPRAAGDPGPGFEVPDAGRLETEALAALGRLYDLLVGTAQRRSFHLGAREPFLDWGRTGMAARRIVLLEVRSPEGEPLGGGMFYRHGGRLTYSHSADRADRRRAYPGVAHLMLWRAIQLARREGLDEVDLAGVDVPGARRLPEEGEPMYGLYAFKRSFGARWIEQVGNHQWVARPWRYRLGRVAGRMAAVTGRGR